MKNNGNGWPSVPSVEVVVEGAARFQNEIFKNKQRLRSQGLSEKTYSCHRKEERNKKILARNVMPKISEETPAATSGEACAQCRATDAPLLACDDPEARAKFAPSNPGGKLRYVLVFDRRRTRAYGLQSMEFKRGSFVDSNREEQS